MYISCLHTFNIYNCYNNCNQDEGLLITVIFCLIIIVIRIVL